MRSGYTIKYVIFNLMVGVKEKKSIMYAKAFLFYFNFQSEELHAAAGGGPKNCVFAQLRINRRTDSSLVCHFNS